MRKQVVALAVLTGLFLGASAFAAGSRGLPNRYIPRSMDGPIRIVDLADGQGSVGVWAYRNGAEYDIAIAKTDPNGEWSDPIFIGQDDGRDQIDPVIAVDANGNVYVAFTDRGEDRVKMAYRPTGRLDWSQPWGITPQGVGAQTPGMMIVGDSLVVAVRVGREIQMIEMPVFSDGSFSTRTINDSPDPIGRDDKDPPPVDDDQKDGSGYYSPRTGRGTQN